MSELGNSRKPQSLKVLSHKVFDGFDVVLCGGFEFRDSLDIRVAKVRGDVAKRNSVLGAQFGAAEAFVDQSNDPFDFDMNPCPIESRFGQVEADFRDRRMVTTIKWAQRLRGKGHISILAVFSPSRRGAPPVHNGQFTSGAGQFSLGQWWGADVRDTHRSTTR